MRTSPTSSRGLRGRFREVTVAETCRLAAGSPPAVARSDRLPDFIGLGCDADRVLNGLEAAVISAGGVGRRVALGFARLQPKTLWICDPAKYKAASLLTQEILPRDVGAAKATSTAIACKALSPTTTVLAFDGVVQDLRPSELADATLLVMATDNLRAEVATGQLGLNLGTPLVHASVHGESLVVQVRFFANDNGAGPCPACGFGAAEWEHVHRETTFACDGGAGRPSASTVSAPTVSTSFLGSLAADLALTQVTRHVLGLGQPVADTMLQYCGYTHETRVASLGRKSDCPCEHVVWERRAAPEPLGRSTLGELAGAAGFDVFDSGAGPVSFIVDDLSFVESALCCSGPQRVDRFAHLGAGGAADLGGCSHCGEALRSGPFYEHRAVPASSVDLNAPLESLGAGSAGFVVVERGGSGVLLR